MPWICVSCLRLSGVIFGNGLLCQMGCVLVGAPEVDNGVVDGGGSGCRAGNAMVLAFGFVAVAFLPMGAVSVLVGALSVADPVGTGAISEPAWTIGGSDRFVSAG